MLEGLLLRMRTALKNTPLYVTGHKTTDTDSYASMILASKLLREFDLRAVPVILTDTVDSETMTMVKELALPSIQRRDIKPTDALFLVDHNNPAESAQGILFGAVDHHADEGFDHFFKVIHPAGSTSLILYQLMNHLGVPVSNYEKRVVLYSLLADTCYLMSDKATDVDKHWAYRLAKELNESIEMIARTFQQGSDFSQPVETLSLNGKKEYDISGLKVLTTYVESWTMREHGEVIEEIHHILKEKEYDQVYFILYDLENEMTEVSLIEKGKITRKWAEYKGIASRGKTILPTIRNTIKEKHQSVTA